MQRMKEIRKDIKNCHLCELRSIYNAPVPCAGSHSAKVMFIGEAPGAEEVENCKPFVGKSGKMLRSAILDSGLSLDDVFITNIICCRPLNNIFPKDLKIINTCINWLYEQIKFIQPKIIVSIGSQPHKYLRKSDVGITKACGIWEEFNFDINGEIYKSWYMPTLHPSFCMRGPDNRYDNPVMNLDSKGKEELFRKNIFSVKEKLDGLKNEK